MKLIKIEGGRINVYEPQILPVKSGAELHTGQALALDGGELVACASGTKPTFVALSDSFTYVDGVKVPRAEIPVGRVESNQIYEVAPVADVTVGAKYTLSDDGTGISSTTGSVAEVVYADSTVAHVRF